MVAARTRLVRRPGAAAARASWLGVDASVARARVDARACCRSTAGCCSACPRRCSSRPARCRRRSCRGRTSPSCSARGSSSSLVVRLLVGRRSPWPVIAAVGGVVVLRCIVTLLALSFTGPGRLLVRVLDRADAVAPSTSRSRSRCSSGCSSPPAGRSPRRSARRRATGTVLAGVGAGLAVPAPRSSPSIGLETRAHASGTTRWGCCRGASRASSASPCTSTSPPRRAWFAAGFGLADRRGRRAARAALRSSRSPSRARGRGLRRPDELAVAESSDLACGRDCE